MIISSYNRALNEGRVQFVGPVMNHERRERVQEHGRFLLHHSEGEAVKTTITIPGESTKIVHMSQAAALASVIQ